MEKYISRKELADYLGTTVSTIDYYLKRGLPKTKLKKKVLFKISEVDAWIQETYNKKED
jgi:excisionase family DNA binding protein